MAKIWHFCRCLVLNTLLRQRSLWDAGQKKGWIIWKCCSGLMAKESEPLCFPSGSLIWHLHSYLRISHSNDKAAFQHVVMKTQPASVLITTRLPGGWRRERKLSFLVSRWSLMEWDEAVYSAKGSSGERKELCCPCYHLFMSEIIRILGALLEYRCQRNFQRNSESSSFSSPVEPHHHLTKWNVSWCFLCQSVNVKTSLFFIRTVQEFC